MGIETPCSRRAYLNWTTHGLGAVALAWLLKQERPATAAAQGAVATLHFPARIKQIIHVFACGGVSQVDTFDYKPALENLHGRSISTDERPDVFFGQIGLLRKSDWKFAQRGNSGLWISDLFPHLARWADHLTVVRSMYAETSNHTPATFQANTGFRLNGFPTLGAWLSYGLGSETDELPAYVVIPDSRGLPAGGSINWANGFLPGNHQGVVFRSRGAPIQNLERPGSLNEAQDQAARSLLATMNRRHLSVHGEEDELAGRMHAYQLAARMQMAVPGAVDIDTGETEAVREAYGLNRPETADFGRSCLLARRLLERGVRFVQLFSGGAFASPRINWDGHEDMVQNHSQEALRVDQPLSALLQDIKQRGMWDDTLVMFTSEFGRTPFTQSGDGTLGTGRDHNQNGFTVWLAGGGLKPGIAYGETDEVGYRAVTNKVGWADLHATVLRLLGVDHKQLTYYHNGIKRRITNVQGDIVTGILA